MSDATVDQDRLLKTTMYAKAGIPTYWIINLLNRRIEVYTRPSGPTAVLGYAHRQEFATGESVPVVVDAREVGRINVDDLLP